MAKANYYAVARGRQPGIYREWNGAEGAEAQVKGYPGARYQGFRSRAEAEAWLRSQEDPQEPRATAPEPPLFEVPPPPPQPAAQAQVIGHGEALAAGKVVIYTDGGCIGNPGPGGYGAVLLCKGRRKELSGGYRRTTNNRMELMACIEALKALPAGAVITLHSDSRYVVNGINRGWARRWRANHWMRTPSEAAENSDLWAELLEVCEERNVRFVWVRGHSGHGENERCDALAKAAAEGPNLPEDLAYTRGSRRNGG